MDSENDSKSQNGRSIAEEKTDDSVVNQLEALHVKDDSDEEYLSAEDDTEDDVISEAAGQAEDMMCTNVFSKHDDGDTSGTPSDQAFEEPCDDIEEKTKEPEVIDDLEIRRKAEESLTDEEKQERKEQGQTLKDSGNVKFRQGDYDDAITTYSEALEVCPLTCHKERSIMFANRAASYMKKELHEEAIADSTRALELHPHYLKALLRRAELYEKTEKLDEALKDYQAVVEMDPSQGMARAACLKLAEQIKDRNEKMKEEMMGKLKDLGNLVLRPFGLSTNNFNLQQDPNTGSYSVQFSQNPPGNGS